MCFEPLFSSSSFFFFFKCQNVFVVFVSLIQICCMVLQDIVYVVENLSTLVTKKRLTDL